MPKRILGFMLIILMAMALLAPAAAWAAKDNGKRMAIHSAIANPQTGLVVILGRNLKHKKRDPKVTLGATALTVQSATDTVITAVLPDPIDPGTYPLTVSTRGKGGDDDGKRSQTVDFTIGAVGLQGPQGPKGDTGATGATGPAGLKGDTGAQGRVIRVPRARRVRRVIRASRAFRVRRVIRASRALRVRRVIRV